MLKGLPQTRMKTSTLAASAAKRGSQTKSWSVDNALPQFLADFCALRVDKIFFEKSLWEATNLMTRKKYLYHYLMAHHDDSQ